MYKLPRIVNLSVVLAVVLLATLLVPLAGGRQKQDAKDRWDNVRELIRKTMEESNLPSISVALAQDGKIVWEEALGWADREKMIPATPNTMYSLASVSKPITATGLMTLVQRGKIDLDKPVNDYLDAGKVTGLAGDANGATVRRVLSHTAGLPLHYQFYYATNDYRPTSNDETISRYGILVNPPGEVYEYSNLGYGIIDRIISRTSGADYTDYMRSEVFVPLGLTHTSVGIAPGLESFAAQRYDGKQQPIPFYDFDHRGASAIYSSAHDVIRFGMFHLKNHLSDQKPILKDTTIDLMHQPVAPAKYGLGWGVNADDQSHISYAHTGGMPGVSTLLGLYPTENLAVVVMTNASVNGAIERIASEIVVTAVPKFAEARRRQSPPPQQTATRTRFTPTPELLGEWTGTLHTWENTVPLSLVFQPDGDVHVRMDGQFETLLNFVSWRDNNLLGRFGGTVPTSDARRWPHNIQLSLRLHNGVLSGMASAQSATDRDYFALTSYASLTKKAAAR